MSCSTTRAPLRGAQVLYRAEEHRTLELLRNLSLGEAFQRFQAAFRRKLGRTYRMLLSRAIADLQAALTAVRSASVIDDATLVLLDEGVAQYHATVRATVRGTGRGTGSHIEAHEPQ